MWSYIALGIVIIHCVGWTLSVFVDRRFHYITPRGFLEFAFYIIVRINALYDSVPNKIHKTYYAAGFMVPSSKSPETRIVFRIQNKDGTERWHQSVFKTNNTLMRPAISDFEMAYIVSTEQLPYRVEALFEMHRDHFFVSLSHPETIESIVVEGYSHRDNHGNITIVYGMHNDKHHSNTIFSVLVSGESNTISIETLNSQ